MRIKSPLTDSNRRPPPYHRSSRVTERSRAQRFPPRFRGFGGERVAVGCAGLRPLCSTTAPRYVGCSEDSRRSVGAIAGNELGFRGCVPGYGGAVIDALARRTESSRQAIRTARSEHPRETLEAKARPCGRYGSDRHCERRSSGRVRLAQRRHAVTVDREHERESASPVGGDDLRVATAQRRQPKTRLRGSPGRHTRRRTRRASGSAC